MALSTRITHSIIGSLTSDNSAVNGKLSVDLASLTITLANGSGNDQANRIYRSSRSLNASASEDIDLYDFGGATDALGQTYALAKVKVLAIRKTSTADDTAALTIGAASSNAWAGAGTPFDGTSPTVSIYTGDTSGGGLLIYNPAGWTVTDASSHLLKIANGDSSNQITYEICVVGSQ